MTVIFDKIAEAFQAVGLSPAESKLLAAIAAKVADEPDRIGSGLDLCRACRAPRREKPQR